MSRQCPEPPAALCGEVIRSAEQTSREMLATVEGKDGADRIAMDVRSFRGIATLLGMMAAESAKCGGEDCMGRALDGIRLWVTKDRFDQLSDRVRHAEQEALGLKEALEATRLKAEDVFPRWSAFEEAEPPRPASFS